MESHNSASWNQVRDKFREIWGYNDFRSPQGEIVQTLLQGKDALIVLPTGGGKSICFQLPALLQTGLTLVVSPLVALMENQVQELRDRHLNAALLHSEVPTKQRKATLKDLENNQLRLLYLSPETLLSPPVWERLLAPKLPINGMILDEAHCLVQWGDTFRPAYRRLGAVRPALLKSKPPGSKLAIAAFTATADPTAQKTLQSVLKLQKPSQFLLSPYRSNLSLQIQIAWTPRGRRQRMLRFIQSQGLQSGLVYVRTRRDAEELAAWLRQQGCKTNAYHGGLSGEERRRIESSWIGDSLQFVVCTCAFGMGVNKPNVRWVLHYQTPALLSEYIQEVGRAGRDGQPAMALSLISECTGWLDPQDEHQRQFVATQQQTLYRRAQNLMKKLPNQGNINQVIKDYPDGAIALSLLHSMGQLQWRDPFHYRITHSGSSPGLSVPDPSQPMKQFLLTRRCRWQFLLEAFGFIEEAKMMQCGQCDNCLNKRILPFI
ncbi:ATP-dependent DNA helicase [Laspinema sp. A4]|uniref:RecQ family ATP-dependent DNA helicase n=1 Tax=Laspinema sp. D2d TaxID=2953686 RepID=UPI0021BB2246|nr:ATP-dependent DNA helicase RecQ [Laspinema sp. D2d]MCT7984248.1 ATP-dependent DNA helicase [Laspinema sp. D2d]